jgi:hypothetical protein
VAATKTAMAAMAAMRFMMISFSGEPSSGLGVPGVAFERLLLRPEILQARGQTWQRLKKSLDIHEKASF